MSQNKISKLYTLVALHVLLATAPLGMALVPFKNGTMPIFWGLASIPLSQLMLLSVWLGMTRGIAIRRIGIAVLATLYITIWPSLGPVLMSNEATGRSMLSAYWQYTGIMLVFLAVLSAAMSGARRLVGTILITNESAALSGEARSQYSLFALLAITTATALILGLVRSSQTSSVDDVMVTHYLLGIMVFVVNTLAAIWATLGTGRVVRRLAVVFCVSIMLGLSLANASGSALDTGPWWLFALTSLVVVIPTTIVAATLLVLRTLGYRLLPQQKLKASGILPG